MPVRVVKWYNGCFKKEAVEELDNGRFRSIAQALLHHGIIGAMTV